MSRLNRDFRAAKGGIMATRRTLPFIVLALILTVVLAGCAKRPATTAAQAPAPTGQVTSTAPPAAQTAPQMTPTPQATAPESTGSTSATQNPTASARPAIKEFLPVPE